MARPRWWRCLLLALLAGQLILVVARIPGYVCARRLRDVARYRELGGPRYHLDNRHRKGARWVEWVRDHVAEDRVLLYRGPTKGALEFVPALVFPRLLWAADAVPAGATRIRGRPIARGRVPGKGEGVIVLVGGRDRVELELR